MLLSRLRLFLDLIELTLFMYGAQQVIYQVVVQISADVSNLALILKSVQEILIALQVHVMLALLERLIDVLVLHLPSLSSSSAWQLTTILLESVEVHWVNMGSPKQVTATKVVITLS
jgi:hypothetical protein